jgi:hypothetical protein
MADDIPPTEKVVFRIPNGSGNTDAIVVDCCEREQHDLPSVITPHPVEKGFKITDHIRPEQRPLVLECVQSNTPPGREGGNTGTADHARQLWQRFVDLWNDPKLISVDTHRDFYDSMAIEHVSSIVDVKSANALKFTITLKQVRVVENTFTQVVPTKDARGQKKRDVGKVTNKSFAARGVDWVGGLFGG